MKTIQLHSQSHLHYLISNKHKQKNKRPRNDCEHREKPAASPCEKVWGGYVDEGVMSLDAQQEVWGRGLEVMWSG